MKKKQKLLLIFMLTFCILLLTFKIVLINDKVTVMFKNDSIVVRNLEEENLKTFISDSQKEVENIIKKEYNTSYTITHELKKQKSDSYILTFKGKIDCDKIEIVETNELEISEYKYIEGDDYISFNYDNKMSYDKSNISRFEIGTLDNDKKNATYNVAANPNSTSVVINKKRRYTSEFVPKNLTTITVSSQHSGNNNLIRSDVLDELEALFGDAKTNGYNLTVTSAFRNYSTQETLFNNYVAANGYDNAITFSAFAGASEHQTGLVIDIGSLDNMNKNFSSEFGATNEGKWLSENAHNYGFILRYPEGKEDITTYIYEPWHFRYVGRELAAYLYRENITLEEFFRMLDT